jgi:hypothetical protein
VALAAALRCFFVAQENRQMAKKQIGGELANAEIERNPFNVRYDASLPWPAWGTEAEVRLACVGQLYPPAKRTGHSTRGACPTPMEMRDWQLSIYGEGSTRLFLGWLTRRLDLSERVTFAGFAKPKAIRAENHGLVMPSR